MHINNRLNCAFAHHYEPFYTFSGSPGISDNYTIISPANKNAGMVKEIKQSLCNPEIWGGIECTINRVGNIYRDQLEDAGHYQRENDIEQFAKLGIKKIRYPVLWEKHLPAANGDIDWRWTANQLEELRNHNITPIAGLLHHGSGPVCTNLLDHAFPEKLMVYAGQVALKFPWLEYYTPVNEPLTTARFSGLYGFWYPHQQQEKSFALMLLQQVKGIILSMQAIRRINPLAKLIQTEDLCKVHSTPLLAYQAKFENERRWLTYDLLCGKFKPGHLFWNHFLSLGIEEAELYFFVDHTCPPDIMGFNYYITSERYLDGDLDNYPQHFHGGNGRHYYADTDAARVNKRSGLPVLLQEAWERYHIPMAITECHLNCTREEQLRWLKEIWDGCRQLNSNGIPVKAVTAWSLLGSFDWNSLLLRQDRHYETGIFDISAGYLRPTLLAKMVSTLASGRRFEHPLLAEKGWWHTSSVSITSDETMPLLIISTDDTVTTCFEQVCRGRRIGYQLSSPKAFLIHGQEPWAVILVFSQWHEQSAAVYEAVITYCRRQQIPLMIVTSSTECMQEGNFLLINNIGLDGMNFAHLAMDLLIDGEQGYWCMDNQGLRKNEIQKSALFY